MNEEQPIVDSQHDIAAWLDQTLRLTSMKIFMMLEEDGEKELKRRINARFGFNEPFCAVLLAYIEAAKHGGIGRL